MPLKRSLILTTLVLTVLICLPLRAKELPYRWVYVMCEQFEPGTVDRVREIARTCKAHGINGMVLSGAMDRLDLDSPYTYKAIADIRQIAAEHGLEIIPQVMGVGYNAFMLCHDKNLAEGLPVRDALFIAHGGKAVHTADPAVSLVNGSFESFSGASVEGFSFPYERQVAFQDTKEYAEGKASLRFEKFGQQENDSRIIQEIEVRPNRLYRISYMVKTEGLDPNNPFGSGRFRVEVTDENGRRLTFFDPSVPSATSWRRFYDGFNSKDAKKVKIAFGVWGSKTGRFWLDDLKVEEAGLVNLLRRPGCPLTVRGEQNGVLYEEGRDFARVEEIQLNFMFDHDGPEIELSPGSRIKEGERLRVSYYHGSAVYQGQTPVCVSEPAVREIWRKQARLFQSVFGTDKYFLNTDEVRVFGSCEACRATGLSHARLLGETVAWQAKTIREVNPNAELFIWSDMFDPNHNADKRDYYYLVDGDFYGAWEYVPKDLVMVCWHGRRRNESLEHFSRLGFRTLAAAYYDADDLKNVEGWLESLDRTEGAAGIMYTTWLNKYSLLGAFGDLVNKAR